MNDVEKIAEFAELMTENVKKVFFGKDETIRIPLIALASSLHLLIEDIPGVGKTTLARAVAMSAGLSFSRIQFTPDLLPGDVLGMNVWNPVKNEFVFRQGVVNAQCVLADELNRTSPRTQSAFLEAMQEAQVTVDGVTTQLPTPFFLIATQNPQNFTGTFPLPEAELDRFGMSFSIGYPEEENETLILDGASATFGINDLKPVTTVEKILEIQEVIKKITIAPAVKKYLVDIIRATRDEPLIKLGASPRASQFLLKASRAQAAFNGRDFVMPEDILYTAPFVLSHRIILSASAHLDHINEAGVIKQLCSRIRIPTGI